MSGEVVSYGGDDVGLSEIIPLVKERLAGVPGECIGEAVAEIQPGRVTALAEIMESLAREMSLLHGKRFDDDAGPADKHIALANGFHSYLAFENEGDLQEVRGADQAAVRVMNDLRVTGGLGLVEENGG